MALTGCRWGSARFDAFSTHPRVSLLPSLGAQAAHALLVPAEVESDILRRVRTLLRELDGHHPACQRDRGMLRWTLHKKIDQNPSNSPILVRILVKELERVSASQCPAGGGLISVGLHPSQAGQAPVREAVGAGAS
uniref:Uncharacterized protein n=1 Tax=Pavo cristatus TaxID=9049 RepID=A0A8C9EZF2_PAVCR